MLDWENQGPPCADPPSQRLRPGERVRAIARPFRFGDRGAHGNDHIQGGVGDDRIHGGYGDDTMDGGEGTDYLDGDDGTDTCLNGEITGQCEG